MRLGQTLQRNQIPFILVDHNYLATASVDDDGAIQIGDRSFRCLILPDAVELPERVSQLVNRVPESRVISDRHGEPVPDAVRIRAAVSPAYSLSPASAVVTLGQFRRDSRDILLLANVGAESFNGVLISGTPRSWMRLDPHNGQIAPLPANARGVVELRLEPYGTCLLVE